MVTGYIFGSSHAALQTDTQVIANQDHILQILRENDHRAALMQSKIHSLTNIVACNSARTKTIVLLLSIMFLQSKQLAVICRGLETLVVDGKLATGIIAPDLLHEKYEHLSKQLALQNRHLSIATELNLFNCQASSATFTYEVLRVMVHIPVYDTKLGDFSLFKYQNIPLGQNNEFYQIQALEVHYLTVSKKHNLHFYASPIELEQCTPMSSFLSCAHFGGFYTARVPSCLWGIFSRTTRWFTRCAV